MTRHRLKAAAAASWTAEVELQDGELEVGDLTPTAKPDGAEYFYCSCGREFSSKKKAAKHLDEVC